MSHQTSQTVRLPSDVAPPTRVDELPQQASTMPGDGSEVHASGAINSQDPNVNVVEVPGKSVPWKDQVIGHAKNARGTVTGNQDLKEEGQRILAGVSVPPETHKNDASPATS